MTALDIELAEFRKANKLRCINNAIWYWTKKSEGFQFWWDKSPEPTREWCIEQIEYFTKMLDYE